jgi:aspartate 1-decarboxylase
MKGKIHRAHVTEADLHYESSISIDRTLIEAAGFRLNERVDIYNIDTGARFSTYVKEAAAGSGIIGLNGAAARLAMAGDKVIIVACANFGDAEARSFQPRVVLVNERNQKLQALTATSAGIGSEWLAVCRRVGYVKQTAG